MMPRQILILLFLFITLSPLWAGSISQYTQIDSLRTELYQAIREDNKEKIQVLVSEIKSFQNFEALHTCEDFLLKIYSEDSTWFDKPENWPRCQPMLLGSGYKQFWMFDNLKKFSEFYTSPLLAILLSEAESRWLRSSQKPEFREFADLWIQTQTSDSSSPFNQREPARKFYQNHSNSPYADYVNREYQLGYNQRWNQVGLIAGLGGGGIRFEKNGAALMGETPYITAYVDLFFKHIGVKIAWNYRWNYSQQDIWIGRNFIPEGTGICPEWASLSLTYPFLLSRFLIVQPYVGVNTLNFTLNYEAEEAFKMNPSVTDNNVVFGLDLDLINPSSSFDGLEWIFRLTGKMFRADLHSIHPDFKDQWAYTIEASLGILIGGSEYND